MNDPRAAYYDRRASEYDAVYDKPERQEDIGILRSRLQELLSGRSVLEIAAGTGFWTQHIAPVATNLLATDVNPAPLAIAETRDYAGGNVRFQLCDAFQPEAVEGTFDAAFAGFWWSHLRLDEVPRWLDALSRRLASGTLVVAADNRFVAGSNHPIARTDAEGNTYQQRQLADGSTWEVLKNFPTPVALRRAVRPYSDHLHVEELTYYWLLRFTLR